MRLPGRTVGTVALATALAVTGGTPTTQTPTLLPPAGLVALADRAYEAAYSLDHDVARETARRAVALYPDEPAAHRTLASVLWLEIMFWRGTVTVEHFMGGLDKSLDRLPEIPPALQDEFIDALDTAKALAKARLDADGDDLQARYELGAAYAIEASYKASVEGSSSAAFGAARRAYDAQDTVVNHRPDYGRACVVVGTYRYVVSTLRFPSRWVAYLFGMRGGKERGIAMIQAATADPRAFVNAQSALLLIFTREERYDEAYAAARALMEAVPRNRFFVLEAGAAAIRADKLDEAEQLLSDGLAALANDPRPKAPGEQALWHYKRGTARLLDDRLDEAAADLALALEGDPIDWVRGRIHTQLGKVADLEGRRNDAMMAYRLAYEIADENADPTGRNEARRWLRRPFELPDRGGPGRTPLAAPGGWLATPDRPTP